MYMAYKTAYARNVSKSSAAGVFEHEAIIGNKVVFKDTVASTTIVQGGLILGDVNSYAPGMEQRFDGDIMMEQYAIFLNKVKYGNAWIDPEVIPTDVVGDLTPEEFVNGVRTIGSLFTESKEIRIRE